MTLYPLIRAEIDAACWAITGAKMAAIEAAMRRIDRGAEPDPAMLAAYQEERQKRQAQSGGARGGVAVIPLYGILCPRANMLTEFSGGTSLEGWTRQFNELVADESISAIVIDCYSPGGMTYFVQETWTAIMAARGVKKVVAQVNPECGSAAYWLATAAQEIVVCPSGQTGSVGVYAKHEDDSAAQEREGVKVTKIAAGEHKAELDGPLSEEAHAWVLSQVNIEYQNFLQAVAKGRGRTVADVKANFGGGRMLMSGQAKAAGMVDRIATLDETIARLVGKKAPAASGRAAMVVAMDEGVGLVAGPVEAPNLRGGDEAKSCMNCTYYSKPAAEHDGGVCSRHDFHAMDMWLCDDWEGRVGATDQAAPPHSDHAQAMEPIQAGLSLEDRRRRLQLAERA